MRAKPRVPSVCLCVAVRAAWGRVCVFTQKAPERPKPVGSLGMGPELRLLLSEVVPGGPIQQASGPRPRGWQRL